MMIMTDGIGAQALAVRDSDIGTVIIHNDGLLMEPIISGYREMTEPLCYCDTEELMKKAMNAAVRGSRTAAVIFPEDVFHIHHINRYRDHLKAGLVFIEIGGDTEICPYAFFDEEKICFMIPGNVEDIYSYIKSAIDLSELTGSICTVLIRKHLRYSYSFIKSIRYKRRIRLGEASSFEKERRLRSIAERINRTEGEGKYLIVSDSVIWGYIRYLCGKIPGDVAYAEIGMYYPLLWQGLKERMKKAEKVLVISHDSDHLLRELGKEARISGHVIAGGRGRSESVYKRILEFLPSGYRRYLKRTGVSELQAGLRLPTVPEKTAVMCPGCMFRRMVMDELYTGNRVIYERFYCSTLQAFVTSGIVSERLVRLKNENEIGIIY